MTYREIFEKAKTEFEDAGIREPDIDARLLLMHAAGLSPSELFLKMPENAPSDVEKLMAELSERRKERYPLQYIIGSLGFYGIDIKVAEGVLIPRADTEILVDEALKHLSDGDEVLDICTGTGCVLLALMKNRKVKRGVGADISQKALMLAEENAEKLGISPKPEWMHADLREEIKCEFKFNLITANPPYIDSDILTNLQPEVRDYEPKEALDGGKDGLEFYGPLTDLAVRHLLPGGWLVTEIGYDQGSAVRNIFIKSGFDNVEVVKDLASDDRVVKGQYNVR